MIELHNDRLLFSFQYDSVSGEPRLATGGFVHALRLMKRLQDYRPTGTTLAPRCHTAKYSAMVLS